MPLTGTSVGPYTIVDRLGAGGMGEVYRAQDHTRNRQVAIKVLLPSVANDPERLARFRREAQVLATLNHPNIAAVHGFELSVGDGRELYYVAADGRVMAVPIGNGSTPDPGAPRPSSRPCFAKGPTAAMRSRATGSGF